MSNVKGHNESDHACKGTVIAFASREIFWRPAVSSTYHFANTLENLLSNCIRTEDWKNQISNASDETQKYDMRTHIDR